MYNVFIQLSIIILSILTVLVESDVSGENFSRFAQASTIVNDKLYIIGGQPPRLQGSNDVFYLDLTKSFDVRDPQWIKASGLPLESSWASAVAVRENGILLFVGYTWDLNSHTLETGANSLYMFNTTTKEWTIPTMSGTPPERRRGIKIVSDNSNKIYVFGGVHLNDSSQGFNNMYILSTSDYSWQLVQMNNGPLYARAYYTANMLPSGVIIYIGGSKFENGISSEVNMSEITIFDTKDSNWYNDMHAGGEIVDGRIGHSAVLTSDVKLIIYGGVNGLSSITASPVLAILDTNTLPYSWSSPQISLQDRPPPLMLHTADIYKNYMIVAFGNITNDISEPIEINPNIYILDTNTYTWITSYSSSTTTSDSSSRGQDSLGLILGIVSAVIAFLVIISVIVVVLYKRRVSSRNAIATPGTSILEEEGGNRDSMVTRDSVVARDSMITNGSNDINAAVIDNSIKPPSRPPSSHSTPYNPNRPSTSTSVYVPHDGIGPNNPPYSSRR